MAETASVMEIRANAAQVSPWAETVDAPIRLARFDCCDRYVCWCQQREED